MTIKVVLPNIEVMDMHDPEATAMLQAFYSRSPKPIRERLRELDAEWLLDPIAADSKLQPLKDKLNQFYVGYGHKSIGELGEIVIFVENISFIAAKAIQHHPLYQGQEVSTRYVDFTHQPVPELHLLVDKDVTEEDEGRYLENVSVYVAEYESALEKTFQEILEEQNIDEDEPVAWRAARAAAFDKARGELPSIMCTSLAWKTDFSNAREHLMRMAVCPFPEVRNIALYISEKLTPRYPSAFGRYVSKNTGRSSLYEEVRDRVENYRRSLTYHVEPHLNSWWAPAFPDECSDGCPKILPVQLLARSPEYNAYRDYYQMIGMISFGTWRDLARHRNGMTLWPLDISNIYPDSLDWGQLKDEVLVCMVMDAEQLGYLLHLRTQTTVHQELREFLHDAYDWLDTDEQLLQVYRQDREEQIRVIGHRMTSRDQDWTTQRGQQTIINKQTGESV